MTMKMVEVKTDDLIGNALGWAVAQADSVPVKFDFDCLMKMDEWDVHGDRPDYVPWCDWGQGGPLIEKRDWALPYRATARYHLGKYEACSPGGLPHNGPTPLIAACRAIVAAEFGDVVSVPANLLE